VAGKGLIQLARVADLVAVHPAQILGLDLGSDDLAQLVTNRP